MSPRRTAPSRAKAFAAQEQARMDRMNEAIHLAGQLIGVGQQSEEVPARCVDAPWAQAEEAYWAATTVEEQHAAAETVIWRCAECPVIDLCEQWVKADRYTGLAAGTAYSDGREIGTLRRRTAA